MFTLANLAGKIADNFKMDTKSTDRDASDVAPAKLEDLIYLLRLKGQLRAIWNAGNWIDEHFGKKQAYKGEVKHLSEALQKSADASVPVSVNHLQKCRQFRKDWDMDEVENAIEVGLSWGQSIELTVIKRLANRLAEKSPERAAQIRQEWRMRLKSFPGSRKSKELSEWMASVEDLKVKSQTDNPGISNNQKRLWVGCRDAAVFRLNDAVEQIDKMCAMLPDETSKQNADSARTLIVEALEILGNIYTRPKSKPKKT